MIIAKYAHILGFTVWVGGMFFAQMAVRPVAGALLEPPKRLEFLAAMFGKFFPWVWVCVALILVSGGFMMPQGKPAPYIIGMAILGLVMMIIFAHIYFAPFRRLRRALLAADYPVAGAAMAQIRTLIAINLVLGILTITTGVLGPSLS